jgi:hypothetical protein
MAHSLFSFRVSQKNSMRPKDLVGVARIFGIYIHVSLSHMVAVVVICKAKEVGTIKQ